MTQEITSPKITDNAISDFIRSVKYLQSAYDNAVDENTHLSQNLAELYGSFFTVFKAMFPNTTLLLGEFVERITVNGKLPEVTEAMKEQAVLLQKEVDQ